MVNCFMLREGRYLFFDIFHKNGELILICPVYVREGINPGDIEITAGENILSLSDTISMIEWESIQVFKYSFKSENSTNSVTVKYKTDHSNTYELPNIVTTMKRELSVTTLFKNDFNIISVFYGYYKKQGVTTFYMYYNGIITEEIRSKFNLPGVVLIEWNFDYLTQKPCDFDHHAQLGELNHALYRYGKDLNEYMIVCDLDEYLHVPNMTLFEYCISNPSITAFVFRNVWSNTIDGNVPEEFPCEFRVSDTFFYNPDRAKYICKTSDALSFKVHYGIFLNNSKKLDSGYVHFHFFKWSLTGRNIVMDRTIRLEQ